MIYPGDLFVTGGNSYAIIAIEKNKKTAKDYRASALIDLTTSVLNITVSSHVLKCRVYDSTILK
jgi:proline racemase